MRGWHIKSSSISKGGSAKGQSGPNVSLLRICRQVNTEATPLLYQHNRFAVCTTAIGSALSSTARRFIKNIEVFWPELEELDFDINGLQLKFAYAKYLERLAAWDRVSQVICGLPSLQELTVNLGSYYGNVSNSKAWYSAWELAERIFETLKKRRGTGHGNVKLEFINPTLNDLRLFNCLLYPEANNMGLY